VVADSKNKCIRLVDNVTSVDRIQSTFVIQLGTIEYAPYGIAVIDTNTIVVSCLDQNVVRIYRLEASFRSGNILAVVDGFMSVGGMCFHPGLQKLLVADGKRVIQVDLTAGHNRQPWGPAGRFVDCTDVGVDADGNVGVVDRLDHTVTLFSSDGVQRSRAGEMGMWRPRQRGWPIFECAI